MDWDWTQLITALVTVANATWIIYSSWRKNKPEVKKLETEVDSEIVEAANANLEGAKISAEMLLSRINELKADLEAAKANIEAERNLRKADREYFSRRLAESDREARDYRLWAAKLVKQVVEAGKIPVAFIPSTGESERGIPTISDSDIEKQQKKEEKKEEKDAI